MVRPSSLVLLISISVDSSAMASSYHRAPANRSILSKTWRECSLLTQSGHRPLPEHTGELLRSPVQASVGDDEAARVYQTFLAGRQQRGRSRRARSSLQNRWSDFSGRALARRLPIASRDFV